MVQRKILNETNVDQNWYISIKKIGAKNKTPVNKKIANVLKKYLFLYMKKNTNIVIKNELNAK